MRLLDNPSEYGNVDTTHNPDVVGVIKLHPVIQLALLVGALAGGGYFTIRFWKELQSLL